MFDTFSLSNNYLVTYAEDAYRFSNKCLLFLFDFNHIRNIWTSGGIDGQKE